MLLNFNGMAEQSERGRRRSGRRCIQPELQGEGLYQICRAQNRDRSISDEQIRAYRRWSIDVAWN